LLFQQCRQSSLRQTTGGSRRNLFQGAEIQFEPWTLFAEGATGDNFAPLGGEVVNLVELLVSPSSSSHVQSFLGFMPSERRALPIVLYDQALWPAKQVMASVRN